MLNKERQGTRLVKKPLVATFTRIRDPCIQSWVGGLKHFADGALNNVNVASFYGQHTCTNRTLLDVLAIKELRTSPFVAVPRDKGGGSC